MISFVTLILVITPLSVSHLNDEGLVLEPWGQPHLGHVVSVVDEVLQSMVDALREATAHSVEGTKHFADSLEITPRTSDTSPS